MATKKVASKTSSPSPRKSPTKTMARRAEGKPPAKSEARPALAPRRSAAVPKDATTPPVPAAAPVGATPARGQPAAQPVSGEARYRWIAHAAYLRAEKRGFAPGHEVDDWLAAEADFEAAVSRGAG